MLDDCACTWDELTSAADDELDTTCAAELLTTTSALDECASVELDCCVAEELCTCADELDDSPPHSIGTTPFRGSQGSNCWDDDCASTWLELWTTTAEDDCSADAEDAELVAPPLLLDELELELDDEDDVAPELFCGQSIGVTL